MTPRQIELARHALGLPNSFRTSYRNRYMVPQGTADYRDWLQMVAEGNATRPKDHAAKKWPTGDRMFYLTKAGAELALEPGEKLDREDFPR